MPELTVITVTHNSAEQLPGFFEALQHSRGITYELVVVDSGSTDQSVAIATNLGARVLQLSGNLGYATGINFGVEHALPIGPVAVLNPDIRVTPEALRRLVDTLDHEVGIAVPQLRNADGSLATSLRRDPSVSRAWGEALLGGKRGGKYFHGGEVEQRARHYEKTRDVDWATGAAMVISTETRRRVGAWDESFFLYGEEVDYAQRARRAGFRVRYNPSAVMTHEGGDAMVNPELWATLTVNRVRLYARQHSAIATAAFWLGILTNDLLRISRSATHRRAARALISKHFWPTPLRQAVIRSPG